MINNTPKVIFACKYNLALNHQDRKYKCSDVTAKNNIGGMFNYFSNIQKRAINMFDYYEGKINKKERVNLILENGDYATEVEIDKRKADYLEYFKNSNLWLGVISFNNDFIDSNIELKELEKVLSKIVMPKFLKYCGFEKMEKMSYQLALHTNTDNYHFHIAFIEKEPNYINSDGSISYRRKGMLSKSEKNYLKNEIIHSIERHKEFSELVIETNKEIDQLKKYFKPGEKNFFLKDIDDLLIEEKILKLGKLLYEERKGKQAKIKYNSINNKEIKKLSKEIYKDLFNNKNSTLYMEKENLRKSLNKINDYFYSINKENNIKKIKYQSDYVKNKQEYIDNYIFNAIVNHSSFKYNRIRKNKDYLTEEEILREAILKLYKNNKKQSKFDILLNYLQSSNNKSIPFVNKYKIEQSIKNINYEMEEAISEFSKLFSSEEKNQNNNY